MTRRALEPLVLGALLLGALLVPAASLEFAPGAPVYRAVTAQFTHWSVAMALADAGACVVLGLVVAARSPWRFRASVLLGALAVSAWLAYGGTERYRGASGIASALFVTAALGLLASQRRAGRIVAAVALAAFAAKIAWEAAGHHALVASALLPADVRTAWESHVAGALGGVLVAVTARTPRARRRCRQEKRRHELLYHSHVHADDAERSRIAVRSVCAPWRRGAS